MKQKHAQIAPFFVVNHQLNDIPYLRQFVRDCAAAGCDGFFMHPRERRRATGPLSTHSEGHELHGEQFDGL